MTFLSDTLMPLAIIAGVLAVFYFGGVVVSHVVKMYELMRYMERDLSTSSRVAVSQYNMQLENERLKQIDVIDIPYLEVPKHEAQ